MLRQAESEFKLRLRKLMHISIKYECYQFLNCCFSTFFDKRKPGIGNAELNYPGQPEQNLKV